MPADRDSLQDFVAFIVVGGTFNATVLSMRVEAPVAMATHCCVRVYTSDSADTDKQGALRSDRGSFGSSCVSTANYPLLEGRLFEYLKLKNLQQKNEFYVN